MTDTLAVLEYYAGTIARYAAAAEPAIRLLGPPLGALLAHQVGFWLAARLARRTDSDLDESVVRGLRNPTRILLVLVAVLWSAPTLDLGPEAATALRRALAVGITVTIGWLSVNATTLAQDWIIRRFRIDVPDNRLARRVHTQVRLMRRVAVTVIVIIVLCLVLMAFESVRQIGISLFASAGVAGLAVGMAARPALANLIAGIQIAATGPINLEDVVIVEGEWGWIEEITATYVVVRIWDQRRLVVPLSYFLEHPFQNWTRKTSEILGTVTLYADYTLPVEPVRRRLSEIVRETDLWDGRVCNLQVVGTGERTMELRALISAAGSGRAWDLRCLVREKLIAFLQAQYPQCLPRLRAEWDDARPIGKPVPGPPAGAAPDAS